MQSLVGEGTGEQRTELRSLLDLLDRTEPPLRSFTLYHHVCKRCRTFSRMLRKTCKGLIALLFIVLEWTRPGLPSPLRPICDLRVLNHFIQEAQDAEVAMKSCKEGCGLMEPVSVPQTTVNFDDWEKKNALEQAQEVQTGLWLLHQALSLLRTTMTNGELNNHIDNTLRNLISINAVLRSLNIQEYTPPASSVGLEGTWRVSSAAEVLQVHVNFLRGKVRLLLMDAQACQQDVS